MAREPSDVRRAARCDPETLLIGESDGVALSGVLA